MGALVTGSARRGTLPSTRQGTIAQGGVGLNVWFTVQLQDRPGSLARVATALAERGVNITGIVGVAEDTDGALMLTTSDPSATRAAFDALGIAYEEHAAGPDLAPDEMSVSDVRRRGGGR
jgi:predicted amino acid-binding ACT domain protein